MRISGGSAVEGSACWGGEQRHPPTRGQSGRKQGGMTSLPLHEGARI